MKILFVTHRYPPRTGGVETHVREIATRLVDRGHDVTVFSADAGSDVPSSEFDGGVRVQRFRSFSMGNAFYVAPQMAWAVRRTEADVVHAHNYHAFPMLFAALGVSDERFIVTTHYHGGSASAYRDRLLRVYRPLGKWIVKQADVVIAVSEWEREQLHEDFEVDATVVPNGLDIDRFANADPEEREQPYLLCVGRLEEYKGIQYVIRALPELPEYDLVIAGSGPYRDELVRVARQEGVLDRVDFLGHVRDDRLPSLYSGARVYLTLSTFEAYGMTVAEALASGTQCVVRRHGALEKWTESPAVIGVQSNDPKDVSNAITEATKVKPESDSTTSWDTVTSNIESVFQGRQNIHQGL
ncbi:glycosyltransferase family 4 protein [Halapricum desulfuricans]|uniref:Glycosyltransferase n=1 Tax=Halapricum desulfuricans TaxID=2841257 RepID=A0A897NA87_9EURY|nr:glycosyltransferase family 4 protein [Halapricum desulfuricans]QSG08255.1 Glycosyltransferase [Halapricum desulfuricans]